MATDKQALISSQSTLNYQQLIIKQAIARNLNDPALVAAPVIPTDRVSLEELPEEKQPLEELVQEAFQQRPELEQAVLTLKNDEITLQGARNALLPTLDALRLLWRQRRWAASQSPNCSDFFTAVLVPPSSFRPSGYGTVLQRPGQQLRARQGSGIHFEHSHPQPPGAVGSGALADGIPAGANCSWSSSTRRSACRW